MPRTNLSHYLTLHDLLRKIWLEKRASYGHLRPHDQWLLHDYFRPENDWTDAELLEDRSNIIKQRPSLSSQAGKALARFDRLLSTQRPVSPGSTSSKDREVIVRPVVRPEIDIHKFSRALLLLAEQQLHNEASDPGLPGRKAS
jgi:hypothetical protein